MSAQRRRNRSEDQPCAALTYLITWTCYGTWLHGDARGSVNRMHNVPCTPYLGEDPGRYRVNEAPLKQRPYALSRSARPIALRAIREVCRYRGWELLAVHVRTNHIHAVVTADATPERVMTDFKAYATRALNLAGVDRRGERRWTRHGSTRYLNHRKEVEAAIRYVLEEQGKRLDWWCARGSNSSETS